MVTLNITVLKARKKLKSIDNIEAYNTSQIKDMLEGKVKTDTPITISEYMAEQIEHLKKDNRNNYAQMNQFTLKTVISILGDIALKNISPSSIEKLERGLLGQSNATKQMRLSHVKACVNKAIKEGIVKYDIHSFVYTKMAKSPARQLDITIDEFIKIRSFNAVHKKLSLAKD